MANGGHRIVGIDSPEALEKALRSAYLADEGIATAAYLALALGKPLLLEGAPGVGKTEAAKAIAAVLGAPAHPLQCYEGIDASAALYEWNYPRQMLAIRQAGEQSIDIYGEAFLIERPMLAALRAPDSTVLLIDEIDRSDQEFEAFLLEFLSDFQISIPERGTIRAAERPVVILTSNRTRDLHEALRRRCVYHWIDYPNAEREARIVMLRASSVAEAPRAPSSRRSANCGASRLSKAPGIAESVDWAEAATLAAIKAARAGRTRSSARSASRSRTRRTSPSSPARLDAHARRGGGMSDPRPAARRAAVPRVSSRSCAPTASRSRRSRRWPSSRRSRCSGRAISRTSAARRSPRCAAARAPRRLRRLFRHSFPRRKSRRVPKAARTRTSCASRRSGAARTSRCCADEIERIRRGGDARGSARRAPLRPGGTATKRCAGSRARRPRGCRAGAATAACAPGAAASSTCAVPCATRARNDGEVLRLARLKRRTRPRKSCC